MNLPEYYIEKNNFYKKDDVVFELIYQNPEYSITLKHPVIMSDEDTTPLNTRIVLTEFFKSNYNHISEEFPTAGYKQKKIVIDHAIKSLSALSGN